MDWDKFKPVPEVSDVEKGLIREIAAAFITSGEAISDHKKMVELGKDRNLLRELNQKGFISNNGNRLYPTFAALYYLSPELRRRCEDALALVLKAYQQLFIESQSRVYSIDEVSAQISRLTGKEEPIEAVRLGMLFLRDFPIYFANCDGSREVPVTGAQVWDTILDFENLQQAWQDEIARRQPALPKSVVKPLTKAEPQDHRDVAGRDFSFVAEPTLRKIIERDYAELQAIRNGVKSRIILAGGLLEALLLDKLLANLPRARASRFAGQGDLRDWPLSTLINVAVDLDFLSEGPKQMSHGVRHFRNLVHPGKEALGGYVVHEAEARAAEAVLAMTIRDLSARQH